jgi:hypothetical protein
MDSFATLHSEIRDHDKTTANDNYQSKIGKAALRFNQTPLPI